MEKKIIYRETKRKGQKGKSILKKLICKFCNNFFWAAKINAQYCDNTCGTAARRKLRKF